MHNYLITGATICTATQTIEGDVAIEGGIIADIGDIRKNYRHLPKFALKQSDKVLPGFIDTHIHGSNGADVMDGSIDSLNVIGKSLLSQGVTGFLATTMTQSDQAISNALLSVKKYTSEYKNGQQSSKILGVHLEGPFISHDKIGAQNPNFLQEVSLHKLEEWYRISGKMLKKVTFAPELKNTSGLVEWCSREKIVASIGHTNCKAYQAQKLVDAGVSQATHLFNAMSGINHRDPGAATVLLASKKVLAELIVDRVHLADEIVKMVYNIKGSDKILLVTDAMAAQVKGEGVFNLGGQKVLVKGNEARLENGALAGSVLTMVKALKNIQLITECNFPALVKMTSTNAANFLGLKDRGDIRKGMIADLVIMDHTYNIKYCIIQGKIT
jgi:N-acetylglucosamine-6-phosphate deacetylase